MTDREKLEALRDVVEKKRNGTEVFITDKSMSPRERVLSEGFVDCCTIILAEINRLLAGPSEAEAPTDALRQIAREQLDRDAEQREREYFERQELEKRFK